MDSAGNLTSISILLDKPELGISSSQKKKAISFLQESYTASKDPETIRVPNSTIICQTFSSSSNASDENFFSSLSPTSRKNKINSISVNCDKSNGIGSDGTEDSGVRLSGKVLFENSSSPDLETTKIHQDVGLSFIGDEFGNLSKISPPLRYDETFNDVFEKSQDYQQTAFQPRTEDCCTISGQEPVTIASEDLPTEDLSLPVVVNAKATEVELNTVDETLEDDQPDVESWKSASFQPMLLSSTVHSAKDSSPYGKEKPNRKKVSVKPRVFPKRERYVGAPYSKKLPWLSLNFQVEDFMKMQENLLKQAKESNKKNAKVKPGQLKVVEKRRENLRRSKLNFTQNPAIERVHPPNASSSATKKEQVVSRVRM